MGKPSAPTPPNPIDTARAQTGTNVSTAVANAYLANINQNTPNGSLTYNQSGQYGWTDPTTNQTYQIPTFTATQTLSPQGQAIQAQTQAAQYNLAGMANAQSGRIAGLLSQNMNYAGEPAGGNAYGIMGAPSALTSFAGGGPVQSQLNQSQYGQPIATTYGPNDFSADRQQVQDALMARMNPQLQIQQQALQQQLADQGIRYGSDAYNNAMLTYNQQANDARWGAIQQAGTEQQRMVDEAAQQAAFQNQAQNQAYTQTLGAGQFANAAQQQQYNQNAGQAQFYNAGAAQNLQQQQAFFNAQQAQQNQWLQQAYAARNQPINEITSLLSGSQVSQPNFVNTPGAQISTTDVAGLVNQNFNQQLANYQQQNQNYNSLIGGVLGLGAGALKISDEREKENVVKMGDILADKTEKLPIYEYEYKKDPSKTRHLGPMAQDVERIDPKSVTTVEGVKYINEPRMMGRLLGVR
jgi:Chaperone of endosialidase